MNGYKNIDEKREDLALYIYEAHKDAYGVKGRHYNFFENDGRAVRPEWTLELLEAEAERIEAAVVAAIEEDAARERKAAVKFEIALQDIIEAGAGDRETAIRWLADANGADRDYGYLEYLFGLRYGYIAEKGAA